MRVARELMLFEIMNVDTDYALAQLIAQKLTGKFWQVTVGEWWVVVEAVSCQKLVILTNDPFEIAFAPRELSLALAETKRRILHLLIGEQIVAEDGTWTVPMAS